MGELFEVDPIGLARPWLLQREAVTFALGGPDRVLPKNEPPYPCVVLTDPPGNDRDLTHLLAPLLQIEVLGDLDGTPGKPALRRILYIVLSELKLMAEQDFAPWDTVVTNVGSTGGGGWSPLPNGQPRYLATVQIHAHPGRVPKPV